MPSYLSEHGAKRPCDGLTQIAPGLAKAAAKMTVRGKGCRFQNGGDVQSRQAGE